MKIDRSNGEFAISLPTAGSDQIATVVVLEIEDKGLHAAYWETIDVISGNFLLILVGISLSLLNRFEE